VWFLKLIYATLQVYYPAFSNDFCGPVSGLIVANKRRLLTLGDTTKPTLKIGKTWMRTSMTTKTTSGTRLGTRTKLRGQWTYTDYADIDSSDDEDTAYDQSTRVGRQVEVASILDRMVLIQTWDNRFEMQKNLTTM
jgi:hypothetical protein